MQTAFLQATARQRNIDSFRCQSGIQRSRFQRLFAAVDGVLNLVLGFVNHCTDFGTIFRGYITQIFHQGSDFPFFTQKLNSNLIQRGHILRVGYSGQGLLSQGLKVFHR